MIEAITSLRGENHYLFNFWPCCIEYAGWTWKSSEHAYQGCRVNAGDIEFFHMIRAAPDARTAKRLGTYVRRRGYERPGWHDPVEVGGVYYPLKVVVMFGIVHAKFVQNGELRQRLLATGAVQLVEGNTWGDHYWGVCSGSGINWLGQILMAVRHLLRS